MLVPFHEHRVQRPVEVLAIADRRDVDRFERVEHRAGADGHAGRAQRAREVEDVLGEAAAAFSFTATFASSRQLVPAKAGTLAIPDSPLRDAPE